MVRAVVAIEGVALVWFMFEIGKAYRSMVTSSVVAVKKSVGKLGKKTSSWLNSGWARATGSFE